MLPKATERLELREAELSDGPFIFELMNSPGWLQFIGDRGINTLVDAENYIQKSLIDNYKKLGFGLYLLRLKNEGAPVGICGFVQRDYLVSPDLGFAVLPAYEGKGYAYEACQALLMSGMSESKPATVYAITTLANERSENLLIRLGFSRKSIIKPNGIDLALFHLEFS
jgi:ribosomal-protein-alanine N-acetyltransferase